MKHVTVTMTVMVHLEIPTGFEGKCTEEDLAEMAASAVNEGAAGLATQVTVEGVCQFNPPHSEESQHGVYAPFFVETLKEEARICDIMEK